MRLREILAELSAGSKDCSRIGPLLPFLRPRGRLMPHLTDVLVLCSEALIAMYVYIYQYMLLPVRGQLSSHQIRFLPST